MSKLIFIVRGLPGSGKSTAAEKLRSAFGERAVVVNADAYRTQPDGKYVYDPSKNREIHDECHRVALAAMAHNKVVVVDNINHKRAYFQPYLDMASRLGYTAVFITPTTPWAWDVDECFRRGTHGVPREVIQRVKDEWETNP